MRSSTGQYYPGLDHLRALAAFLVFGWHFTHGFAGTPAPFGASISVFFLAPFDEGHCGVALFMCLSGYLFARILDGKAVNWRGFYWNRFVRLAPLLAAVFLAEGVLVSGGDVTRVLPYARSIITGFVQPTWPNGGWSIAIELHFYLLLPIIMLLKRRWQASLFCFVALGIALRLLIYAANGDVAYYAYWTIIGRIDQFMLGVIGWEFRRLARGRHVWLLASSLIFGAFYYRFLTLGGFYGTQGNGLLWIAMPTVEAIFFAFLVAYYDTSFAFSRAWYWRALEAAGAASFSIYLLHFFFVFWLAGLAHRALPAMATWGVAEAVAAVTFVAFVPIAWLSYRYFESPFLRLRTKYTRETIDPLRHHLRRPSPVV